MVCVVVFYNFYKIAVEPMAELMAQVYTQLGAYTGRVKARF